MGHSSRLFFSSVVTLPNRSAEAPYLGRGDRFTRFAEALGRELAPRSLLERVLADRVILSAWTMEIIAEKELAIGQPCRGSCHDDAPGCGSSAPRQSHGQDYDDVDASPQGVLLVTQCLEKALELLHHLRAGTPGQAARPAPAATDGSLDLDVDSDFDSVTLFDIDSELDGDQLADLSNEWPVVPRGRQVEDQADDDAGKKDRSGSDEDRLAARWGDRLAMDLSVSEDSPVIRGTWVTVSQIVSLIVDGWTWSDILRTHPELTEDDIRTSLAYTVAEEEGEL